VVTEARARHTSWTVVQGGITVRRLAVVENLGLLVLWDVDGTLITAHQHFFAHQ
jgi:hypothetical protein